MPDFNNITDVLVLLSEAQEADADNRQRVRDVTNFLEKDDGQWEPSVISAMSNRPRYTFDKCNPVVDSIAGEMEQAEFGIKVRPAGGEATKELAALYDGMIRNIQSMSNAESMVYTPAARQMVAAGFDAWRVVQDWADSDSFEQDLLIQKIANSVDRVWFDTGSELQDRSDSNWAFVLQALTNNEYKERWPDGSGMSVSDARTEESYCNKPDQIIVGEFLYKKPVVKELVLMSNNSVYEVDDKYQSVVAELAESGIIEVRRRKKKSHKVVTRLFDGKDWLTPPQDTVFDYIPIVPTYANFKISENKVIYRGVVNKLMDAQRVYNYAQSRSIEEGALAPRAKFFMTKEQANGHQAQLQTLNTNADPVQFYEHVEGQPPPFWQGGAQINAGLSQTSADMSSNITESSGVFAANQGNAPMQSGVAIELQQQKGDNSTIKYFTSQEIAITHTARILINAIPKIYDSKRIVRVLGEDGASKMETINDQVLDNETGELVALNDLRKGKYDVVCDVGPAFKNRQQETARFFLEAAGIDPSIIEMGKDIWLANLTAPGSDAMAERARKQLLESGAIPDSQMTDEEKEVAQRIIQQAQAEAEANAGRVDPVQQAILEQTQAQTADVISKADERTRKANLAEEKQALDELKFEYQKGRDQQELLMKQNMQIVDVLNKQADTLNKIKEAIGAEVIVGPSNTEAYKDQAELIQDTQDEVENVDRV